MASKVFKRILKPYMRAGTVTLILFALALLYFNSYAGIAAFLVIVGLVLYSRKLSEKKTDLFIEYAKTITNELEETIRYFIDDNPFPLCMVDSEENIFWFNDKFKHIFPDAEMLNSSIAEITGLRYADLAEDNINGKHLLVNRKDRVYRILTSSLDSKESGSIIIYWMDVTSLETLKDLYNNEKVCFAYINVDNFDELISSTPDERKSIIASQIEIAIRQWSSRIYATVIKYSNSNYFVVFEQKYIKNLETTKFSILDEIREVDTDADFPASLSIGVGVGGKNLIELEEYASAALDLALGRGGDQAVVKRKSKVDYFGGKLQTVEKRNKGKSRIMAHALRQMIDQSGRVIIMGHKNPDMDSFGAALGISRIVKNRNKEGGILIANQIDTIKKIYEKALDSGEHRFISPEEAKSITDKDTLLVIVDTHRPSLLDCPDLLNMTDKIVIIDHHRKAEDNIDNATLTYMESYASSTSELVSEILQYIGDGKKNIEKYEAEALLAGIMLDTKNFSIKTGVRTFEAASWLRRNGADTISVRQLFQTDIDFFKLKASIIAEAEMLPQGVAISSCGRSYKNVHMLTSQAADDLLEVEDIKASFVVGIDENGKTFVSARSLGEVNVQTIMEKMGGGGHLATAGAQLDIPVEDTVLEIKKLVEEIE
ncbi:MAG: DHH family phosphoesterase [Clostridiales bacterium]|nr:DHH family phosphoesterase [Clostridiales bacterium]